MSSAFFGKELLLFLLSAPYICAGQQQYSGEQRNSPVGGYGGKNGQPQQQQVPSQGNNYHPPPAPQQQSKNKIGSYPYSATGSQVQQLQQPQQPALPLNFRSQYTVQNQMPPSPQQPTGQLAQPPSNPNLLTSPQIVDFSKPNNARCECYIATLSGNDTTDLMDMLLPFGSSRSITTERTDITCRELKSQCIQHCRIQRESCLTADLRTNLPGQDPPMSYGSYACKTLPATEEIRQPAAIFYALNAMYCKDEGFISRLDDLYCCLNLRHPFVEGENLRLFSPQCEETMAPSYCGAGSSDNDTAATPRPDQEEKIEKPTEDTITIPEDSEPFFTGSTEEPMIIRQETTVLGSETTNDNSLDEETSTMAFADNSPEQETAPDPTLGPQANFSGASGGTDNEATIPFLSSSEIFTDVSQPTNAPERETFTNATQGFSAASTVGPNVTVPIIRQDINVNSDAITVSFAPANITVSSVAVASPSGSLNGTFPGFAESSSFTAALSNSTGRSSDRSNITITG